jgi:hypothetical protein
MSWRGVQTYLLIGLIVSLSWTRYADMVCPTQKLPHVIIGAAFTWPIILPVLVFGAKPSCNPPPGESK